MQLIHLQIKTYVYQNNKCGFIDSKGNIKIPCKFDEAVLLKMD
ncbi:WG repeat-containing protein [Clostridium sp. K25]|nr:WG repeat-containing protein [Clostridium sp. K25]